MGRVGRINYFATERLIYPYDCSYSRRIIWLEVATTNNDPYVIAGYFVNVVKALGGNVFITGILQVEVLLLMVCRFLSGYSCRLRH